MAWMNFSSLVVTPLLLPKSRSKGTPPRDHNTRHTKGSLPPCLCCGVLCTNGLHARGLPAHAIALCRLRHSRSPAVAPQGQIAPWPTRESGRHSCPFHNPHISIAHRCRGSRECRLAPSRMSPDLLPWLLLSRVTSGGVTEHPRGSSFLAGVAGGRGLDDLRLLRLLRVLRVLADGLVSRGRAAVLVAFR